MGYMSGGFLSGKVSGRTSGSCARTRQSIAPYRRTSSRASLGRGGVLEAGRLQPPRDSSVSTHYPPSQRETRVQLRRLQASIHACAATRTNTTGCVFRVTPDSAADSAEASLLLASHCFNFEGYPAFVVAFVNASTVVFASSNFTTASAFSRFTSAWDTPPSLVNDLFTEITHPIQVIPETASVTVLISAYAAVANKVAAAQPAVSNVRSLI